MNTFFVSINPKILENYLDEHVRELCKYCKRYGKKVCCPPYLPVIEEYKKLFIKYKCGTLLIKKFTIDDIKKWEELGKNSSEELRQSVILFINSLKTDKYTYFGAGSCKNCKTCSNPCRFPDKQLIPLEGLGLNVVKLVEDIANITLKFPVENYGYFYRIGLVLYEK